MNESYRLRYTNQIVGVFLLIFLVSTIALGIAVTRVSRFFVTPDLYYFELTEDKVADLRIGTEVIVLGRRIGQLEALDYVDNSGNVRVTLGIDPQYSEQITNDSEVALERKFGLGTIIIKIRRRPSPEALADLMPLSPGETIRYGSGEVDRVDEMAREVKSVSQSIQNIESDLRPTLNNIKTAAELLAESIEQSFSPAADRSQDAFESVERTSEALRPDTLQTLEVIRTTSERLERDIAELTQRIQVTVDEDLRNTLLSIKQTADAAQTAALNVSETSVAIDSKTDKTAEDVSDTLLVMRQAIQSMQKLITETRQMVQVLRGEANQIPGTTQRFNDTVEETQELVGEIRDHWLLRNSQRGMGPSTQVSPSSVRSGVPR